MIYAYIYIMSLEDMFKESHYWDNGRARPYCGVLEQFYSTPLQNVGRGIVIQQPLYFREKLTDSAVYQSPAFFRL